MSDKLGYDSLFLDDAGSACRGAINMRIGKLYMDPQDKTRFEIQGKSSVKYHLKANHAIEAKRWFWALNNAIQWTKDEAKDEEQRKRAEWGAVRQARTEKTENKSEGASSGTDAAKSSGKGLVPATAVAVPSSSASRLSLQDGLTGSGTTFQDDQGSAYGLYEPSVAANDMARVISAANTATLAGDLDDGEEYGDDASSHELKPANKDAFNITAQSATLQLNLLAHVSGALQKEIQTKPETSISDSTIVQAFDAYEGAVKSLQSMVGDLLKISRDRDAYWQYRLDREADTRRLWEDSMARVAREQEELEGRIGESEDKRKRTKRALREALEIASVAQSRPESRGVTGPGDHVQFSEALENVPVTSEGFAPRRKSIAEGRRRRSTIADLTNLSDSDSDADEEFFDAVGAGEVEVINTMPLSPLSPSLPAVAEYGKRDPREVKQAEITPSFKGYEDSVRKRLKMDADDRPKISLWVSFKIYGACIVENLASICHAI